MTKGGQLAALHGFAGGQTYSCQSCQEGTKVKNFGDRKSLLSTKQGELKLAHPDVPGQDIQDFGNPLAHEYFGGDLGIAWNTIQNDWQMLLGAVQTIEPLKLLPKFAAISKDEKRYPLPRYQPRA